MRKVHFRRRILTVVAATCALTALPAMAPAEEPLASTPEIGPIIDPIGPIGPIGPTPIRPPIGSRNRPFLVGHLDYLTIEGTKSGNFIKIEAPITVENTGAKTARNVRVAMYFSRDQKRPAGEEPIAKFALAAFDHGDGMIKPGASAMIPIKYKLPELLAPTLMGKYVIFVVAASNVPAKDRTPIAVFNLWSLP